MYIHFDLQKIISTAGNNEGWQKTCTVFTEELVNGELEKDKMLKAEVLACRKVTTVPPRLNAASTKTIILLTTMVQNPGV